MFLYFDVIVFKKNNRLYAAENRFLFDGYLDRVFSSIFISNFNHRLRIFLLE